MEPPRHKERAHQVAVPSLSRVFRFYSAEMYEAIVEHRRPNLPAVISTFLAKLTGLGMPLSASEVARFCKVVDNKSAINRLGVYSSLPAVLTAQLNGNTSISLFNYCGIYNVTRAHLTRSGAITLRDYSATPSNFAQVGLTPTKRPKNELMVPSDIPRHHPKLLLHCPTHRRSCGETIDLDSLSMKMIMDKGEQRVFLATRPCYKTPLPATFAKKWGGALIVLRLSQYLSL